MAKRTTTLMDECDALTRKACALVDARDEGDTTAAAKLEAVRAERDALKAMIATRDPGTPRNYVRAYLKG